MMGGPMMENITYDAMGMPVSNTEEQDSWITEDGIVKDDESKEDISWSPTDDNNTTLPSLKISIPKQKYDPATGKPVEDMEEEYIPQSPSYGFNQPGEFAPTTPDFSPTSPKFSPTSPTSNPFGPNQSGGANLPEPEDSDSDDSDDEGGKPIIKIHDGIDDEGIDLLKPESLDDLKGDLKDTLENDPDKKGIKIDI